MTLNDFVHSAFGFVAVSLLFWAWQSCGTCMICPRTLRPHTFCSGVRFVSVRFVPVRYNPVWYISTSLCPRIFLPWQNWGVQNIPLLTVTSLYVSSRMEKCAFSNFFPWFFRRKYWKHLVNLKHCDVFLDTARHTQQNSTNPWVVEPPPTHGKEGQLP